MRAAANSFSAVNVFFVALCHCLACSTFDHAGTSDSAFIVGYSPGCIFFSPAALTHLSPQTCVSRSLLVALPYAMFLLSSLAYCLLYLWTPVSFSAIFRFSHCLLAHYLNHLLVCPHVFSGIGVCRLSETGCLRNLESWPQCMISQFPSFQTLMLQWIQSILCSLAGICISTILCNLQLMAIAHRNGITLRTQDHTSRFAFQTFQPCSRCGHPTIISIHVNKLNLSMMLTKMNLMMKLLWCPQIWRVLIEFKHVAFLPQCELFIVKFFSQCCSLLCVTVVFLKGNKQHSSTKSQLDHSSRFIISNFLISSFSLSLPLSFIHCCAPLLAVFSV